MALSVPQRSRAEFLRAYLLIAVVLVAGALTRVRGVPITFGYVAAGVSLTLALLVVFHDSNVEFKLDAISVYLLLVVYGAFIMTLAASVLTESTSGESLVRTVVFVYASLVCVVVLPSVLSFDQFLGLVARLSALVVVVGAPTAIIGEYGVFGVTVTPHIYGFNLPAPFLPAGAIQPITSVFDNPNVLGFFTVVGFAASLQELFKFPERRVARILVIVNASGAYLSGSRAAVLMLALVAGVFVVHSQMGSKWNALFVPGFLAALLVVLAASFGFSVVPDVVPRVNLKTREHLWPAAWKALETQPVLGFGLGNRQAVLADFVPVGATVQTTHNSYLRMALTTGVMGAGAYVLLFVRALYRAVFVRGDPGLVSVVGVLLLHQLFGAYSIFGLAFNSLIAAILLGYTVVEPSNGGVR